MRQTRKQAALAAMISDLHEQAMDDHDPALTRLVVMLVAVWTKWVAASGKLKAGDTAGAVDVLSQVLDAIEVLDQRATSAIGHISQIGAPMSTAQAGRMAHQLGDLMGLPPIRVMDLMSDRPVH